MSRWRARRIAGNWRAGNRHSINLLLLLRGWCRRNEGLKFAAERRGAQGRVGSVAPLAGCAGETVCGEAPQARKSSLGGWNTSADGNCGSFTQVGISIDCLSVRFHIGLLL